MSDSASHRFDFPDPFSSSPFAEEDMLKRFEYSFPDSAFMKNFNFELDSLDTYRDIILPDMKELQKQIEPKVLDSFLEQIEMSHDEFYSSVKDWKNLDKFRNKYLGAARNLLNKFY